MLDGVLVDFYLSNDSVVVYKIFKMSIYLFMYISLYIYMYIYVNLCLIEIYLRFDEKQTVIAGIQAKAHHNTWF